MAEAAVWLAQKLAEYLVDPTSEHLQYLFRVGKITRSVEIIKEDLILKQGMVQERVQEAINRTDSIDDDVIKWKKDVESVMEEVEELLEELRDNNGYLGGWCPTWRRYCLCKNLAETTRRMNDLSTKTDHFNTFSHPVIVPGIEYHSSKDFTLFESTKKARDELLGALQDDGSYMIGLWGMGGSGKTTLVKQAGKKAKELKLFDKVIITTISQTLDIRKIQGEIADLLGLKLEGETEAGRARRIAMRLQSPEERILIILDDVWAKLNLEDIGNPFGDEGPKNCKVILTTRCKEVCTLMDCQKIIQLDLLKEDEAWNFFQTHAHVDDDAAKEAVAQAIARECKGLPIALVAVGTCLKGKGIDEMDVMLYKLRNAKPVISEVDKGVRSAFSCLELSYDYLSTSEAKLLLLMCAMFPEDHKIDVEHLFRYGMGLGLFRDVDSSFEIARKQVRGAINYLINSSLLMHSPHFNYVTMHDVVRDFALWKASKEDHTIMVNCTKELNGLIADEGVKNFYAISSWYDNNELVQFPSQLVAPKLEFLLFHLRRPLDVSHTTFEGIKRLKALIIKSNIWDRIEVQPQSLQHLSNLRILRLKYLNLRDISFVISLARLEILDLQDSKFERVPNDIGKLNKLKLLDFSNCTIDEYCFKVMKHCSQLEELYVPIHCSHSKQANCYDYLAGPTALMRLRRYDLVIGECSKYVDAKDLVFLNKGTRSLQLGQLNISMLGAIIKDLAQKATAIEFYELEGGSKCFMPNIVQAVGSMNELTKLYLRKCSEIECITDKTIPQEDVVVSRLDALVLRDMDNLRQLCRGPSPLSLFQKLETLSIFNCHKLLHIFPADCNLGNLKGLHISECPMLTSLFQVSMACTLLSLEELVIEDCGELKHVAEVEGGGACEEQPIHDQYETQIVFPLLEYLRLENLPSHVGIFPEGYHPVWPSMKTIEWIGCPKMELKSHQLRNEEYKPLAAIEAIELNNCGVESIFYYQTGVEEQIPKFQYLTALTLENCARLKFVFSAPICQSLPELTSLSILGCEELETIFLWNEETQNNLSITESCLLKLYCLEISKCNKLKYVFMISAATSMLPQLSTLSVSDCSQMEEIFKCSNIEDHDINNNEREITFPNMEEMELHNLPRLINVSQGFKLHTREIPHVEIYNCPKLISIKSATMDWTEEGHEWYLGFGDDGQEETNDWERLRSEQQMLGDLVSTQLSLLHSLEVTDSKEMKFLFSMSTIVQNSLPKLNSLRVSDCEELEVIFGHSGADDANYRGPIVFSNLRQINLINLPNFKSVCQVGLQIQVELSDISICNCPKFVDSNLKWALQQLGTLLLPQVSTDSNVETSSNVNEEKGVMLTSRAEHLQLKDSSKLISLWEGPTVIKFQNLKELIVSECRRLKCIFPSTVIRSLPCLWRLWIKECEELEEMMTSELEEYNHFPEESSNSSSSCFPQLETLGVTGCGKLKCLFPSTQHLPLLECVVIERCYQLKGLFNCVLEIHEEDFYNNILPNLISLTVDGRPTTLAAPHRRKGKRKRDA